jgi:thiosulfate/3-mercaptopyruvate sulfurtransferase
VKNEYYGLNEGLPGDVHLRQARLACVDCHSGDEMHGMTYEPGEVAHRYDGAAEPSCETCHEDDLGENSTVLQHQLHGTDLLSCQSCHSVAYTNCVNCHVDRSAEDVPFFTVEEHFTGFFLGRNTLQSEERPWAYVPVRHVPVDPESFSAYGDDLLTNFLNRPTWAYATPHSIQRNTPQTETCITCHDNNQFFLTPDKVEEFELGGANLNVVVEKAPPFPENLPEKMKAALAAIERAKQMKAEQQAAAEEEAESAPVEADVDDVDAAPDDATGAPDAERDDNGGTGSFWSNGDDDALDAENGDGASSFWSN